MSKLFNLKEEYKILKAEVDLFFRVNKRVAELKRRFPEHDYEFLINMVLERNNIDPEMYSKITDFYKEWFDDQTIY